MSRLMLAIGLSLALAAGAATGPKVRGETQTGLVESERRPRFSNDEPQVSRVPQVNEEMHRRVLAIKKWVLGPGHPSVATSLNALAEPCTSSRANTPRPSRPIGGS